MKIIEEKHLNNLAQIREKSILEGYDVYLSGGFVDNYGNPSDNCPIYIDKGEKKCIVVNVEKINNWKEEIAIFIKENLPKIENPICRFISPNEISQELRGQFVMELSRAIYNRGGDKIAQIIAHSKKPEESIIECIEERELIVPTIEIEACSFTDEDCLSEVMDIILNHPCANKFKGVAMWYNHGERSDYTIKLGFQQILDSISYRMI